METITKLEKLNTLPLVLEENLSLEQVPEEQNKKPKANFKKRLPLIILPLALITLAILYATSVINTTVFTAILLAVVSAITVLVILILIKSAKEKKGIKKWIIMLAKLVPMIPLLALYLSGTIDTILFTILKAAMLGAFIVFTVTMLIIKRRNRA